MSISAASFIYVAISDLIPHLQEHTNPKESIIQILLILAGISAIYFMSHTH
jgi:zinc and cadmium transporter